MRVLNVEDNAMKHYQIKRALEYCGAKEVDCCNNLQEELERLKETQGTKEQKGKSGKIKYCPNET